MRYIVIAIFGLLVFEVSRTWFSWHVVTWAWGVCQHFDYNNVPWPGVDFWVKQCSGMF